LPNEALPKLRGSQAAIQNRFIALLKPPFKSSDDYHDIGWSKKAVETAQADRFKRRRQGMQNGSL
jgi:hypothetical protein